MVILLVEGGEVVVVVDVLSLRVTSVTAFQVILGVFPGARLEDLPVPMESATLIPVALAFIANPA
jgi:hypothetical protein